MESQGESDYIGLVVFVILVIVIRYVMVKNNRPSSETHYSFSEQEPVTYQASEPSTHDIQQYATGTGSPPVKGVFVVVTSSHPQTQMMAMSLSTQIHLKGKSVRILLCGPGGDLVIKGGKEEILKPLNKSPQMMLKELIQKGVKVELCPFYMANKTGPLPELIDGVTPAQPPLVADGLLEPGIKLFTF